MNHSKEFLERYGSLKPFEMEGVEKLNHTLKMAFYRSTNHGCCGKAISEQVIFNVFLKNVFDILSSIQII